MTTDHPVSQGPPFRALLARHGTAFARRTGQPCSWQQQQLLEPPEKLLQAAAAALQAPIPQSSLFAAAGGDDRAVQACTDPSAATELRRRSQTHGTLADREPRSSAPDPPRLGPADRRQPGAARRAPTGPPCPQSRDGPHRVLARRSPSRRRRRARESFPCRARHRALARVPRRQPTGWTRWRLRPPSPW